MATKSKNDLKCGKIVIFFYNDVIMTSFLFQISEFPSLSSCSESNAQLPQKNNNSLTFMLNQSCLGMLQIIHVKIFFKCIIKDGGMPPQTYAYMHVDLLNAVVSLSVMCEKLKELNQSSKITNHKKTNPNMVMGLLSQTSRVPPGIGCEIYHFGLPKG